MSEKIVMYGANWCRDCIRAQALLDNLFVPYDYINLVDHPEEADTAKSISGRTNIPVIVFPDGTHQVEPTSHELQDKLLELEIIDEPIL